MGGAFVAVANDSSATWWNPGALADGPFLDAAIGFATTEVDLRPSGRPYVRHRLFAHHAARRIQLLPLAVDGDTYSRGAARPRR